MLWVSTACWKGQGLEGLISKRTAGPKYWRPHHQVSWEACCEKCECWRSTTWCQAESKAKIKQRSTTTKVTAAASNYWALNICQALCKNFMLIIISLTLTATHGSNYYYHLHFPHKKTKVWRGNLTYSQSCSKEMSEPGFEPNPSDSKTQTLLALLASGRGPFKEAREICQLTPRWQQLLLK